MPFVTPSNGDAINFHQRSGLDSPAVVTSVLQPGGSQVNLTFGGSTFSTVDHASFVDQAASDYWTYGDDRDGFDDDNLIPLG